MAVTDARLPEGDLSSQQTLPRFEEGGACPCYKLKKGRNSVGEKKVSGQRGSRGEKRPD